MYTSGFQAEEAMIESYPQITPMMERHIDGDNLTPLPLTPMDPTKHRSLPSATGATRALKNGGSAMSGGGYSSDMRHSERPHEMMGLSAAVTVDRHMRRAAPVSGVGAVAPSGMVSHQSMTASPMKHSDEYASGARMYGDMYGRYPPNYTGYPTAAAATTSKGYEGMAPDPFPVQQIPVRTGYVSHHRGHYQQTTTAAGYPTPPHVDEYVPYARQSDHHHHHHHHHSGGRMEMHPPRPAAVAPPPPPTSVMRPSSTADIQSRIANVREYHPRAPVDQQMDYFLGALGERTAMEEFAASESSTPDLTSPRRSKSSRMLAPIENVTGGKTMNDSSSSLTQQQQQSHQSGGAGMVVTEDTKLLPSSVVMDEQIIESLPVAVTATVTTVDQNIQSSVQIQIEGDLDKETSPKHDCSEHGHSHASGNGGIQPNTVGAVASSMMMDGPHRMKDEESESEEPMMLFDYDSRWQIQAELQETEHSDLINDEAESPQNWREHSKKRKRAVVDSLVSHSQEPCYDWETFGVCLKGAFCDKSHFIHCKDTRKRVSAYKNKPCVEPATGKLCRHGPECGFAHPGEALRRPMPVEYIDKQYFTLLLRDEPVLKYPFGLYV